MSPRIEVESTGWTSGLPTSIYSEIHAGTVLTLAAVTEITVYFLSSSNVLCSNRIAASAVCQRSEANFELLWIIHYLRGRGQETPGEDPYLSGQYGATFTYWLEGGDQREPYLKCNNACGL